MGEGDDRIPQDATQNAEVWPLWAWDLWLCQFPPVATGSDSLYENCINYSARSEAWWHHRFDLAKAFRVVPGDVQRKPLHPGHNSTAFCQTPWQPAPTDYCAVDGDPYDPSTGPHVVCRGACEPPPACT